MAFLRARASWFRAKTWVAHAHSVPPSTSLPRVTLPTLELSDHLHRVPRLLSGEMEAHPSTQRIARFPLATLPSRSPTSSETVCDGKTSGPGAWTGDFPGDSLRARRSLSPGECPRRPLTPAGHLIPAISGPPTPRAGRAGPGVRESGLRGGNPANTSGLNPPLRRSHFASIRKGVLLEEWRNMGRPPGDGFSPSRGWLLSGLYVGRACALRPPLSLIHI